MPESWQEALSKGQTWILGALFVTLMGIASADRVSIGETIQLNSNRITRLEEQQDNVEALLEKIDAKLDRLAECQSRIQRGATC